MTFIKFVSIIHSQETCMTTLLVLWMLEVPYILEYNPHPFYSFRGLKKIRCGLDSRSRAGFWINDTPAVHAVRTVQYNHLLFNLLL
jgi:hypothetical protein